MRTLRLTIDLNTELKPADVRALVEEIGHPAITIRHVAVDEITPPAAVSDKPAKYADESDLSNTRPKTSSRMEPPSNANEMMVIFPWCENGVWMFDDDTPGIGLKREPFVLGASEAISRMVDQAQIANAEQGISLMFSSQPFPGHTAALEWLREEDFGNWYVWRQAGERDHLLWLCPALFYYFDTAPKKLFARADATKKRRG